MTSKPNKLSPVAMLFFFYQDIKNLLIPIAIFALAVFRKSQLWIIIGIIAVLIVVIIGDVLAYLTFSYQFFDQEILVRKGIFVKKVNHIPYDRIQNVTAKQWFFLKPFKLEELEIETAGHSEGPEVSLVAVPLEIKRELEQHRQGLKDARKTITKNTSTDSLKSYAITWHELIKFSMTSPAFLSGLLVVLALYGKIQHSISKQMYEMVAKEFIHLGWVLVGAGLIIVLLIFYVVSVFVLIAKYYHFHLTLNKHQLEMEYGFFKTQRTSISQNRIQAVVVKQTLLRRCLHIATVKLVIISNSKKEETEKDITVMPVIETRNLPAFFQEFFPEIPLTNLPGTAVKIETYYYDLRNALIFSLATDLLLGWFIFKLVPFLSFGIIMISAIIWLVPAYFNARRANVAVLDKRYVFLQNNQITAKNIYLVSKNNIQLLERRQSIWLSKKKFAHLSFSCRSGTNERKIKVKYLPQRQIDAVVEWYKKP